MIEELIKLAKEIMPLPSEREMDMLLATGEQTTIALTAMALHSIDIPAVSLTGSQAGIQTDDEVAFYDALAANGSAREIMGDDKLKVIATELITKVRQSVTIDWTLRESARAKIRVMVKRILNKFGYPPDLQEEAVRTVLRQAELLCAEWA